jgi:hypothetical protein
MNQLDRIESILKRNKGKYVSAMDIYLISWSLSIATQISYIRRKNMRTIENKLETQPNGIRYSWYKLCK